MRPKIFVLFRYLSGLVLATCLSSCALPLGPKASATRDHAFISHWPTAADSGELRLAVKDIIDMRGEKTTGGSQYLMDTASPARHDAELMRSVRRAGVEIVGKTNMTELALGVTGENAYFGTPVNPIDRHRIPGGSSSGSAVAVANDEADVAFGSDSAGSIRIPAACCGILGLKTTFGLVSLKGVLPLSPKHMDTVGPMAKDVARLAKGMDLLKPGFSERYETARANHSSGRGLTVGRFYVPGADPKIEQAIDEVLRATGFRVVRLDDHFKDEWNRAQSNARSIVISDGYVSDRQYLGKAGVELTTQATIRLGEVEHGLAYKGALDGRRPWRRELRRVFDKVDFIALPTMQSLPPHKLLFERSAIFEARALALQNTVAVNYAGNPAIAIPIPFPDEHFPVTSVQLIGPNLSEAGLVNAARLITAKAPVRLQKERH